MLNLDQNTLVRRLESDSDWDSAAEFRNKHFFARPLTADQLREGATFHPDHVRSRRTLMSVNGHDVSYCSTVENYWMSSADRFEMSCMTEDDAAYLAHFDHECGECVAMGANKLSTWPRSTHPERIKALESRGFVATQYNPESALFLAEFEPNRYGELLHRVGRQYEFLSFKDYALREPETWKHEIFRLDTDVMHDVPLPEPFVETPFESWVKELDSDAVHHDALFVAVLDGYPVGMTQLLPTQLTKEFLTTGLTGVRRDHRRRGLAKALKVHALTWAKENGFGSVWTDNEENNPMYELNAQLGFKKQFDHVCMEKDL